MRGPRKAKSSFEVVFLFATAAGALGLAGAAVLRVVWLEASEWGDLG